MVCKLPLAIFICGMLGTAHAIQMVREERPMLREERPQTRPAKKTFFSDRHTPHSALTAHPLAASLAHVVEQSSNSSTPGTAAKVGSMAQALVALAAKGPMADAFAPVIASIRTSLRTDINNTVSGVGTQLQAKMDAISACATNHGYNSAGIATRIAYDSAKSAYDTAKAAVQTATTAAETECGTKDTKCTTRDNRGNALHNTITTGGDCGAAAPNMFDLENFPLKDASTWADQIKTAVTAWETAATTCATAETTCATKQTDISNALTEKGTKCTALATAATNGKQAYDTCYDTAKGQLTGYDYQAQVTTQKDAIEQIEKLICIVKVAVKSHEEGGTASTDGAIACGDVPVSSGGTTTQAQYRCTCTSSSLTPSEQYQETYDIGVTVPSEPEKDTAWDDKGCADATTRTTTKTTTSEAVVLWEGAKCNQNDGTCKGCLLNTNGYCMHNAPGNTVCYPGRLGSQCPAGSSHCCQDNSCRPCVASDGIACTHPGTANQAWCNSRCNGENDGQICVRSHCYCPKNY